MQVSVALAAASARARSACRRDRSGTRRPRRRRSRTTRSRDRMATRPYRPRHPHTARRERRLGRFVPTARLPPVAASLVVARRISGSPGHHRRPEQAGRAHPYAGGITPAWDARRSDTAPSGSWPDLPDGLPHTPQETEKETGVTSRPKSAVSGPARRTGRGSRRRPPRGGRPSWRLPRGSARGNARGSGGTPP